MATRPSAATSLRGPVCGDGVHCAGPHELVNGGIFLGPSVRPRPRRLSKALSAMMVASLRVLQQRLPEAFSAVIHSRLLCSHAHRGNVLCGHPIASFTAAALTIPSGNILTMTWSASPPSYPLLRGLAHDVRCPPGLCSRDGSRARPCGFVRGGAACDQQRPHRRSCAASFTATAILQA